jgi:predicted site-specific integrase-resolvase
VWPIGRRFAGGNKGYWMPSGTIVVTEEEKSALQPDWVVISARVCSRKQADDLERQVQGRCIEVVNLAESNREDLLADLTGVI